MKHSRYIISFISFFSDSCAERYFLAGPGNLCSALNGKVIDDANECSDAANSIGKLFDGELRNQELPSGCLLHTPTSDYGLIVYYNNINHDLISPSANLLCKKNEGMSISDIYKIYIQREYYIVKLSILNVI